MHKPKSFIFLHFASKTTQKSANESNRLRLSLSPHTQSSRIENPSSSIEHPESRIENLKSKIHTALADRSRLCRDKKYQISQITNQNSKIKHQTSNIKHSSLLASSRLIPISYAVPPLHPLIHRSTSYLSVRSHRVPLTNKSFRLLLSARCIICA